MAKGFTVRSDDAQTAELEGVAKAAGVPGAEETRQTILGRIEENQRIFDRLTA